MNKIQVAGVTTMVGLLMSLGLVAPAFAQTATVPTNGAPQGGWGRGMMHKGMPGVFGTVSAISGNTLTVAGKVGRNGGAATTYTVDATNATVDKAGVISSLSVIVVGDTVMVQGTVTGSNVVATTIHDGMPKGGMRGMRGPGGAASVNPMIQGNGQPIVGGSVTTITGTSLTVTNKSNVVYSVDASTATVTKAGASSTVTNITVGDNVIVQGTVNGSAIVATSVIDQGATPVANTPAVAGANPDSGAGQSHRGFFGGIFGGFMHLFGF